MHAFEIRQFHSLFLCTMHYSHLEEFRDFFRKQIQPTPSRVTSPESSPHSLIGRRSTSTPMTLSPRPPHSFYSKSAKLFKRQTTMECFEVKQQNSIPSYFITQGNHPLCIFVQNVYTCTKSHEFLEKLSFLKLFQIFGIHLGTKLTFCFVFYSAVFSDPVNEKTLK